VTLKPLILLTLTHVAVPTFVKAVGKVGDIEKSLYAKIHILTFLVIFDSFLPFFEFF
tara:strand:- start:562 stop:732 length:171 start_codon:yes stop_codon:yes gene_type:complete